MRTRLFLLLALLALQATQVAAEEIPAQMAVRGTLLVDQSFATPLPPFDGKSRGFASGFRGWRHNAVPRGGRWESQDGVFTGTEDPAMNHPATASYGFPFQDVIIQCEVRMNDIPLEGRKGRSVSIRTTDEKDYVCSVILTPQGFRIQKDDNDHEGPDKALPLADFKNPISLNEWVPVLFVILGNEMCVTIKGHTLKGQHPLIATNKHSIMFVAAGQSSMRHFKVWEAKPKADR